MRDNIVYISGVIINIIIGIILGFTSIFFNKKNRINPDAIVLFVLWSWVGTFIYIMSPLLRKMHYGENMIKKEDNIPEKIYERFCKEKNISTKEIEMVKIENIIKTNEPIKAAHKIYLMYGADIIAGLNYNDQIKELLLIMGK